MGDARPKNVNLNFVMGNININNVNNMTHYKKMVTDPQNAKFMSENKKKLKNIFKQQEFLQKEILTNVAQTLQHESPAPFVKSAKKLFKHRHSNMDHKNAAQDQSRNGRAGLTSGNGDSINYRTIKSNFKTPILA